MVGRIELVKAVMAHAVKRSAAARVAGVRVAGGRYGKPVAPAGARAELGRVRPRHRNHVTLSGASVIMAGACMSRISTTVLAWRSSTVTATILSPDVVP